MTTETEKPTSPVVATREGYTLHENGELWRTGEHGFMAGYVSSPERLDEAIANHEEEMEYLMAEAAIEFG